MHFGRVTLLSGALILLIGVGQIPAQTPIDPGSLSSRGLANLNDASAIGWNPATLGLLLQEYELLVGTGYDSQMDFMRAVYGVFGRYGPVGAAVTGGLGDSARRMPRQYYFGGGYPVYAGQVFAGASVRWLDGAGFGNSYELALAGIYRPIDRFLAGLTLGNVTGNNGADPWLEFQSTYVPAPWVSLRGGLRIDTRDTLLGAGSVTPTLGATFSLAHDALLLTGSYDFNHRRFGVGAEVSLGYIGGGTINRLDGGGNFQGGVALVRWGSTLDPSVGTLLPGPPRSGDPKGWAPARAYAPAGIDYTESVANRDATRNHDAIVLPCKGNEARELDSPPRLMAALDRAGVSYAGLAKKLRTLVRDPADLLTAIRRSFYTPSLRNRELRSGDSLALYSLQGHSISIQSVDASRFPLVSAIMHVTDATGRSVRGLGPADFAFRDTSMRIVSVKPTDSTFNVPVDVVILVDCSGSMSDEIEGVRRNVQQFVDLLAARGADYRIGGVLYGSIIYDTLHPTPDIEKYRDFVEHAAAIGGDEITTLAVKAATEMNFRPEAQRIFVMITDDWAVQNNSRLDESALTRMLWDAKARLFSVITPCKNNSAVVTRLTLGREYDITSPFNSILDEIGTDITTSYQLVYESQAAREEVVPRVTILRGRVRDEGGEPVATSFELSDPASTRTVTTNQTTGEYEQEIKEGAVYLASMGGDRYLPLREPVDLRGASPGDTITHDFTLRFRPTTVSGRVVDEQGNAVSADVRIEDLGTPKRVDTLHTDGTFRAEVEPGKIYRFTPSARNFIPTPEEIAVDGPRGSDIVRDLHMTSIDAAIASGAVFRLQNIFFDYDRWDLKPASFQELDRLVGLLKEYPEIKAEVGAHTDSRGSDEYNLDLSAKRAAAVVDYLRAHGISPDRLTSRGYGESVPVGSNDTDEGRALNRRVEFRLLR